tara:strand:- start:1955 stop:2530 length:576 start_codon:yes stop_codon:yes gene_type:complete
MCEPTTAIAIASAAAGLVQAQIAANEQNAEIAYKNSIRQQNRARAHQTANEQIAQTQAVLQQEVQDELDAGFESALIGRQKESEVLNAAAGAGVAGVSVWEVTDDINAATTRQLLNTAGSVDTLQTQARWDLAAIEDQRFANIQSNRDEMKVAGVGAGDFAAAAAKVGGSVAKTGEKKGWWGQPTVRYKGR